MKIGRWLNDAEFYFLVEKGDQFTHPLRSFVPFCFHHSSALKKKSPLLNICKLDTYECRKKQQSLMLLFKCIRNIGPKYIRDFFSIRETSYNLKGVNFTLQNL